MTRRSTGKRRKWSAAHLDIVRTRYPHEPTARIAADLNRAISAVYSAAAAMGISKTDAYLASPHACRLRRGDGTGSATRFQPGHVPWNKGLKGWKAGGRSDETRFKKGSVSPRWDQEVYCVGALRINTDGVLEIKIAPGPRQWRILARYTWETERGPIPRGMVVCVKDGDPHNAADIGNLELLTRPQLMKRNSYHNWPKPLAQIVQLRGALNRKINNCTKTEETHA